MPPSSGDKTPMRWRLSRPAIFLPALLFLGTLAALYLIHKPSSAPMTDSDPQPMPIAQGAHIEYEALEYYFMQNDPEADTDPATFNYMEHSFGLITTLRETDQDMPSATHWQKFEHHLSWLNSAGPSTESVKLLFLARHGQGVHNIAESFYGTRAWDCHWAALDGNGTSTWADAHLTPQGEADALAVNAYWRELISKEKIPTPESYYTSPLDRCMRTAQLTFSDLPLPPSRPFEPTVKELLRETNGVHTCDRRSTRSEIAAAFPDSVIEPALTQADELWRAHERESSRARDVRLKELLDDLFTHDEAQIVWMSSHGGAIASILRVVGHPDFPLKTGAVIPVLVRAERMSGDEERRVEPWDPAPNCDLGGR